MTKTQFVSDYIQRNPNASYKDVSTAWTEAGGEGSISQTYYYNIRRKALNNGSGRAKKPRTKGAKKSPQNPQHATPANQASDNGLTQSAGFTEKEIDSMEAALDTVLFKLALIEETDEIQEMLRSARRKISRLA